MSPKTPSSSISGSIPIAPAANNDQKRQEKYPKIQPALAIKPKPVPIAVLPKPSNQPISTFDPNSRTTSLKNDISLNINTSKKWVLPPRPRPGRKPTEECPKRKKTQGGAPSSQASPVCQNTSITNQQRPINSRQITPSTPRQNTTAASGTGQKLQPVRPRPVVAECTDSEEVNKLKLEYLAKLKEQQLILNYMEVITKQIKELNFVQNGVITFDALNADLRTNSRSGETKPPPEQLEKINNINDLEKFLAYLTKSSNIIHSVTKKFMGLDLNSQLKQYLELREKWKKDDRKRQPILPKPTPPLQPTSPALLLDEITPRCPRCDNNPCFCLDVVGPVK